MGISKYYPCHIHKRYKKICRSYTELSSEKDSIFYRRSKFLRKVWKFCLSESVEIGPWIKNGAQVFDPCFILGILPMQIISIGVEFVSPYFRL